MIYNYAPYNEIAERFAQEGYSVVRLDMLCKGVREINITDYVEGITVWSAHVQTRRRKLCSIKVIIYYWFQSFFIGA